MGRILSIGGKGQFPVRCGPQAELRTRPQGGSLNVPRPDGSKIAGARSGSHPQGRNEVQDAPGVDSARTVAGLALSVGKGIQMHSDPSERILEPYEAQCVAVQHRSLPK